MSEKTELLEIIRDQYYDIQLITMHCCSEITPEAIPDLIKQRTELINRIAIEEEMLSDDKSGENDTLAERKLREEIRTIISSIVNLDKQVETVIKNQMKKLETEFSNLHKASQAVSAYAFHSVPA